METSFPAQRNPDTIPNHSGRIFSSKSFLDFFCIHKLKATYA